MLAGRADSSRVQCLLVMVWPSCHTIDIAITTFILVLLALKSFDLEALLVVQERKEKGGRDCQEVIKVG